MSTFIPLSACNGANLSAPNPPKEYKTQPPKTEKYTRTYFQYNYGTVERPTIAEPLFELQIASGIVKRNPKGAWKLNLRVKNEADRAGAQQLDWGVKQCVFKWKGKFGCYNFTVENPGDLRGSMFFGRTEDGEVIQGSDPIMSLKMDDKTRFKELRVNGTDPATGQVRYAEIPIDYKMLEGKSIECGVVFCARDLYHAQGTTLPQFFTRSCLIFGVSDKGAVEHTK